MTRKSEKSEIELANYENTKELRQRRRSEVKEDLMTRGLTGSPEESQDGEENLTKDEKKMA